jgi:hypothetical protein
MNQNLISDERARCVGRLCVAQHEAAELRAKLKQKDAEIDQCRGGIAVCDSLLAQIEAAQKPKKS